MESMSMPTLAGVTPETFNPLLGCRFFIEGAEGLRLQVELLTIDLSKPNPPSARQIRQQPFTILLSLVEPCAFNVSGTFLFLLEGFPAVPIFLNRVMPPLDRDPGLAYLQGCFA